MKMSFFHFRANKSDFHKKGFAVSLIYKVRVIGTRKWLLFTPNYELLVTIIWSSFDKILTEVSPVVNRFNL